MFLSFHFKITKDCWVIEDEVKNLKFVKTAEPACNRIIVIFEKLNFNFKKVNKKNTDETEGEVMRWFYFSSPRLD